MATTRSSRASDRRARQASEGRLERRIYLAAAIVGVAVVAIIAAGVILTVVMPPRATAAQVGDRTLTARDIAVRAKFAAVAESNTAAAIDPSVAIPLLTREEVLRQKVGDLGVSVSDEDMAKELRTRIGVAEDAAGDVFNAGYDRYLRIIPLSRNEYEHVVRAAVLRRKAVESFKTKVGEKGPQLHLFGVTSPDQKKLQEMRDAVAGGKDFTEEAVARGLVTQPAQADLAWFDPQSLPDRIAPVRNLKTKELFEVIFDQGTGSYFLDQVLERVEDRTYDDTVKDQVANRQFTGWMKEQETALVKPSTLSGTAESWVKRQVERGMTAANRRSQEAQQGQ